MPEKVEALGVLLVLLPGFACAYVVQMLAVRRKQTELDKIVEALLFSLFLYVATLPFFGYVFPIHWQNTSTGNLEINQIVFNWKHLSALAFGALALGMLYAASINHDWLMWAFRKMRITERTARSTIWNDVFQETGGYVQVGLSDGRCVLGWLSSYSDEASEASLFLEQAAWIVKEENGSETEIEIEGPGILLTSQMAIEYVIFLGWRQKSKSGESTSVGSEIDRDGR
jgi:hypothetical protein